MIPRSNRLSGARRINHVNRRGKVIRGELVLIKFVPRAGGARFAFAIGTNQAKLAVVRNRLRRQARAAIKDIIIATPLPPGDYLIHLRPPKKMKEYDFAKLKGDLQACLSKLS